MQGLHLVADLRGCTPPAPLLSDAAALRTLSLQLVREAGLHPVGDLFHPFPAPGGVTGVVLLAESHLALHTWPELGVVTLDIYVCNRSADNAGQARALLDRLCAALAPQERQVQAVARGR
jgi:S-adenosylmethionine decarboxylase